MRPDAPRVLTCELSGSSEFILAYGPTDGPQLLVLQPLFEEMNRCRAMVSALCRGLAERGIGCWLPDLPGTGESIRPLETVRWTDWTNTILHVRAMITAASGRPPRSVALRGGALLDRNAADTRWRFAPVDGRSLISDLRRSALMGGGDPNAPAGYRIPKDLQDALQSAEAPPGSEVRTVRLVSDERDAALHIEGTPLWRRPEPGMDEPLVARLTEDIISWSMP